MLNPKRTAYVFTANTAHVAQANMLFESLRNANKGNFKGDIWVISTHLEPRCCRVLDKMGIKYLINPLYSMSKWEKWREIAKAQPEYHKLKIHEKESDDGLRKVFNIFRNKRMSKLIMIDWVNKFGKDYDFIAMGDNDLYFQTNLGELLEGAYSKDATKIYYWHEENPIIPNSWLWTKSFNYLRFHIDEDIEWGEHEINIGFIAGTPKELGLLFSRVRDYFYKLNIDLFTKHFWHDQDIVRLIRDKQPDLFQLFTEGEVLHLCNGGNKLIVEEIPLEFVNKKTNTKPCVIHFAGGAWKNYPSIADSYNVNPNIWFFINESKQKTYLNNEDIFYDIYQNSSKWCSESNINKRNKNRIKWLDIDCNKPRILVQGWFKLATHSDMFENYKAFFTSNIYNIAVLEGNVTKTEREESIIVEDLPEILASLTILTKDTYLINQFGREFNFIEYIYLDDAIKALQYEYNCERKTALACANLLYFYFYEAIGYYQPDIFVVNSAFGAAPRVIKGICKKLNIPICNIEHAVLPGTYYFDFVGHMGSSWVAEEYAYFNGLPITNDDILAAKEYLEIAHLSKFSRNSDSVMPEMDYDRINLIKQSGKKIILYIESHSAGSGNIQADIEAEKKHSPFYFDDVDVYKDLIIFCQQNPEYHLVYRPHPIARSRGLRVDICKDFSMLSVNGNLNDVIALADICITILSQGAYVALMMGKPTIVLGKIQINNSGAAYEMAKRSDLEALILTATKKGFTSEQKECLINHCARLLKYAIYSDNLSIPSRRMNDFVEDFSSIISGDHSDFLVFNRTSYLRQLSYNKTLLSENPLVSIIVPVNNEESYISRCLFSLQNQTLQNIEIICIINGTIDNSRRIIEQFAYKDNRIIFVEKDYADLSTARNDGVKLARGKYICFVDADDYLDETALAELLDVAQSNKSDVVYFFFREVHPNNNYARPRFTNYLKFFPNELVFPLDRQMFSYFIHYPFAVTKLISRELLEMNDITFDENLLFEDNPHNLRLLLAAQNPYVYNKILYNYRRGKKAISTNITNKNQTMIDIVEIMNNILIEANIYAIMQPHYVPYKIHMLSFAWDILPEECREAYYEKQKTLFMLSDRLFFDNDETYSIYSIPYPHYSERIRKMLDVNWEEFNTPLILEHNPINEPYKEIINLTYAYDDNAKRYRNRALKLFGSVDSRIYRIIKHIYLFTTNSQYRLDRKNNSI